MDALAFYGAETIDAQQCDLPDLPVEVEEVWQVFRRLSARRVSGFGPAPITFEAIAAFARLNGCDFTPWEVETIEAVDRVWLVAAAELQRSKG